MSVVCPQRNLHARVLVTHSLLVGEASQLDTVHTVHSVLLPVGVSQDLGISGQL